MVLMNNLRPDNVNVFAGWSFADEPLGQYPVGTNVIWRG
jgi:hypothetical protein